MKSIKKYMKPCITIISINSTDMLCSSYASTMRYVCSDFCKLWHICQDREKGKFCKDKKYNWL